MKIRASKKVWVYDPVLMDIYDARTDLKPGDKVRVVKLPGCPPPGTMGMCHVGDPVDGKFIGLVCVNSLKDPKEAAA